MPRKLRLVFLLFLAAGGLALAGCTTAPPRPAFPSITFSQVPRIKLDVREIKVEQAYQPPHAAPNVEHFFAVPPAAAATLWAVDRLAAAGPLRRARFIVREASVVEIPLKQSGGLTGTFTTEQSERYDDDPDHGGQTGRAARHDHQGSVLRLSDPVTARNGLRDPSFPGATAEAA
jgi:hypothetical protein